MAENHSDEHKVGDEYKEDGKEGDEYKEDTGNKEGDEYKEDDEIKEGDEYRYDFYKFEYDKYLLAGHSGKQRTKKEAEEHTNRFDPSGHCRKIVQKLHNAEQKKKLENLKGGPKTHKS